MGFQEAKESNVTQIYSNTGDPGIATQEIRGINFAERGYYSYIRLL